MSSNLFFKGDKAFFYFDFICKDSSVQFRRWLTTLCILVFLFRISLLSSNMYAFSYKDVNFPSLIKGRKNILASIDHNLWGKARNGSSYLRTVCCNSQNVRTSFCSILLNNINKKYNCCLQQVAYNELNHSSYKMSQNTIKKTCTWKASLVPLIFETSRMDVTGINQILHTLYIIIKSGTY